MKEQSSDSRKKTGLILVAETLDNRVLKISRELTGVISAIAGESAANSCFVACGDDITAQATELAQTTAIPVFAFQGPDLRLPNPEAMADAVCKVAREITPEYICFLHTTCGCHAAALTSVTLDIPCITAVENISHEDSGPLFCRSLFNGTIKMRLAVKSGPAVLTVLPGAFKPSKTTGLPGSGAEATLKTTSQRDTGFTPVDVAMGQGGDAALEHADIIVAAGRGIGDRENLAVVEELASLLPNATVAASRPLCDINWMPYSRQVGATGKTVSPRLYIACGISGAQQHVYGMKDSRCIVAINTDPNAAIFSVAHYCVVEDILTFLPLLAEEYKRLKNPG
ncbi:MAG: hypothetical protein B5M56_02025 [Desulfococcus sp. 4484_241]|nr:MAG: hypothetical protein B5M56_02025 [Desulfococcus sp. 4484_241]